MFHRKSRVERSIQQRCKNPPDCQSTDDRWLRQQVNMTPEQREALERQTDQRRQEQRTYAWLKANNYPSARPEPYPGVPLGTDNDKNKAKGCGVITFFCLAFGLLVSIKMLIDQVPTFTALLIGLGVAAFVIVLSLRRYLGDK